MIVSLIAGTGGVLPAQVGTLSGDAVLQQALEEAARQQRGAVDLTDLVDLLRELQRHPVDLNRGGAGELARLPFLNDFQIASLLDYRKKYGPLLSLNELLLVYGFDRRLVELLRPFVTLTATTPPPSPALHHEALVRVRYRPEEEAGYRIPYDSGGYAGGRIGLLVRYALERPGRFHMGVTGENDPGEPFFQRTFPHGFDLLSWHAEYRPARGMVRQINAGDYRLRIGRGLLLWNGFSLTRPAASLDHPRHAPTVRYSSSASEGDRLRGIALLLRRGSFTLLPFFSYARRDARVVCDSSGRAQRVVSLPSAGLHRTAAERARRRQALLTEEGFHAAWEEGIHGAGITLLHSRFSPPLHLIQGLDTLPPGGGRTLTAASIDYHTLWGTLLLRGEAAVTAGRRWALLQEVRWQPTPEWTGYLQLRHYDPACFTPHARAPARGGAPRNEEGLLLGMLLRPWSSITLNAYADLYRFLHPRPGMTAPSAGSEAGVSLAWQPAPALRLYLRYRRDSYRHDLPAGEAPLPATVPVLRDHLRLQADYPLTATLSATTRLDMSRWAAVTAASPLHGFLTAQDLHWRPRRPAAILHARLALFDTRHPTRIYTYEHDLLYAFSTPSFTGRGMRGYLTLTLPMTSRLRAGIRIARTLYRDRNALGDGLTRVNAPHRTEIKIQIRWRR